MTGHQGRCGPAMSDAARGMRGAGRGARGAGGENGLPAVLSAVASTKLEERSRGIDYDDAGGFTMATGFNRNIGMLLLGLWLVLTGLSGMVALGLPTMLMAVLALIAGVLIIVGR